ncbi:MAG TPA: phytanoyl-CoA dioxygenase family protein [Streptosporangiaceae bacterium]
MAGRGDKTRFDDLAVKVPELGGLASGRGMKTLVTPLLNQPYRLIESYALLRGKDSVFYLHNGAGELMRYGDMHAVTLNRTFSHSYHDGKLYCNFIKVLIYLSDLHSEDDGPFCFVQGSHKANFPWFGEDQLDGEKPALTQENFPSLERLYVLAGDAVIINEALLHGTLPKSTEGPRLVMAFSYSPAFIADWKAIDVDSDDIAKLGHY